MTIHRSPAADIEIPDVPLVEHVLGNAQQRDDKVALVDATTGQRLTYRELAEGATAAARGLASQGMRPGDVVAIMSHNQRRSSRGRGGCFGPAASTLGFQALAHGQRPG